MTAQDILFVVLGACAGGFVNGLAGAGTALFALGFFLVALDPVQAVAIAALMSVTTGLQGVWVVRHAIGANMPRLLRFVIPGMIGVPAGIALLSFVDARALKLVVAAFLILYGGFFSFRAALPRFRRRTPVLDGAIGLTGGVLGGMASLSGALPLIWCSMRPWPKAETRAVLQPFNVAILLFTVVMLAFRGAYDAATLIAFAVALPASLVSAQIGLAVFKRISDNLFRRLLISLSLLLGLGIVLRELF